MARYLWQILQHFFLVGGFLSLEILARNEASDNQF